VTPWVALAVMLLQGGVAPQTQIVNGRGEVRQAAGSLDREIAALAERSGPLWVAYSIPTVPGPRRSCSSNAFQRTRVLLEPPTQMTILIRLENRRIVRLQTATPDCEVDAGGLPVVWLNGISSADSASWLAAQIRADGNGTPEARILSPALMALVWHTDRSAIDGVIALARDDRRPFVRSQALFWLAQRAGEDAVRAIQSAVNDDPETEVKKKAVFALSQLPKDQGVPLLIQVARTNRNREVRKQAMFWLGQSRDARAVSFFEDVLK